MTIVIQLTLLFWVPHQPIKNLGRTSVKATRPAQQLPIRDYTPPPWRYITIPMARTPQGHSGVIFVNVYLNKRIPPLSETVLLCSPDWLCCLLHSPLEISHSLTLTLLFRTLLLLSPTKGQCHTSEAWRNRETGKVIMSFKTLSCPGIPLTYTAKVNFPRRWLECRKQNQFLGILLSLLECRHPFWPLQILYVHSLHLLSLKGFSCCLALHREAPAVASSLLYQVPAAREAGYAEVDTAPSLLRLWMKDSGIPLNE